MSKQVKAKRHSVGGCRERSDGHEEGTSTTATFSIVGKSVLPVERERKQFGVLTTTGGDHDVLYPVGAAI